MLATLMSTIRKMLSSKIYRGQLKLARILSNAEEIAPPIRCCAMRGALGKRIARLNVWNSTGTVLLSANSRVALTWILFRLAAAISKLIGKTGINIVTRLMGLIMAAMGVEFIANGLKHLFPVLVG